MVTPGKTSFARLISASVWKPAHTEGTVVDCGGLCNQSLRLTPHQELVFNPRLVLVSLIGMGALRACWARWSAPLRGAGARIASQRVARRPTKVERVGECRG